jgi:hypothetical protein
MPETKGVEVLMFIALVGLIIAALFAGQVLARKDESNLRIARRAKLLDVGWT